MANNSNINNATNNQVSYIQIDSDSNYFNTNEQIKLRNTRTFTDRSKPSIISGSIQAIGFFSDRRITQDQEVYNSPTYATSSTVFDPSGNPRPILALNVDYFASSTIDIYKQGVEITKEKHWTAGQVKITAGTPGHLYNSYFYGVNDLDIIDADIYYEIDVFDPIKYIETGGDPDLFVYPIITSDVNQRENYVLNGIIEPFPIRPVISNFSLNFPFEPHSVKGGYGVGNMDHRFASDQVLSIDYYEPAKENENCWLDAVDFVLLAPTTSSTTGSVAGYHYGYQFMVQNTVTYFEDTVPPRGKAPDSTYTNDLLEVVNTMAPEGISYISNKQKTGTCGFVYNGAIQGTDSIAYGGLRY